MQRFSLQPIIIEGEVTEIDLPPDPRYRVPPDLFQRAYPRDWRASFTLYGQPQVIWEAAPVYRPPRWKRVLAWLGQQGKNLLKVAGVVALCLLFGGIAALAILLAN